MTVLIDAMLDLHGEQYLTSWPWSPPVWPQDPLMQPVDRWTAELVDLVAAPPVFGRLAILGWCLLDDQVAAAAQASGMLAGIARGITPAARDFLTPVGRVLLRRRAPLVALTVGELPPALDLQGVQGAGSVGPLAVAPPPAGSTRTIGHWAAASGGQVIVGQGPTSRPLFPDSVTDPVLALGWSRSERLQVMTRLSGLSRVDPDTLAVEGYGDWAPTSMAMVTPDGIVAAPGVDAGIVTWGVPDGVGPVPLPELDQASGALVAVAAGRVAALGGDRLWFREPESPWTEQAFFDHAATVITATDDHVLLGNEKGEVQLIPWEQSAREAWRPTSLRVLDGPVRFASGGGRLAIVASEKEFAVVSGAGLLARWSIAASGPTIDPSGTDVPADHSIAGVSLSHEGAIVAVSGYPLGLRFWRVDANPEVRLTSYSADTPEGEDYLGILPTVDALAAIVVARAVQPPLSLGLFGAWGSGKSFFMRRLEHRVGELSQESHDSGRAQASLWAWRNVRQVRFNAWHYASADVWAGMLEQLVRELARPTTGHLDLDPRGELDELERARINRLAGAVEEAHGTEEALREAQDALAEARETAAKKEDELAAAQAAAREARAKGPLDAVTGTTRTALDSALQAANLPQATGSLDRTLNDIDEARRSVRRVAGLATSPGRRRLAAALLAIFAVGVLITFALQRLDLELAGAFGILGSMLAAVGVVARWVTSAAGEVQRRVEDLDAAEVAARMAIAEIETALTDARAGVVTAEEQLGEAQRRAEQAELKVAEARRRVARASPGDLLVEYLEGRNAADDYRGMLGLIGTVRRDLEVISDAVDRNNRQLSHDPDREPSDAVNRVVLYIDDLDRCPPVVVVKVLEALSMLLTFPLFVVVVAVDAHWISKSLAAVYPKLLTDGDVTPDNYLEKIFQMPVWLDRPSQLAASTMARALLAGPDQPGGRGTGTEHSDPQ